MTLETGVKELAEAVAVDVKALNTGKVNSNDPRLTDAREWSAATVTQAEAEAGTASTRRAWTAQRVWQAINAWWQLVTSGFGRNFIAASNEQAARNVLQLGTAATANLTTSSTDSTAGRVLRVGDFGVGGNNPRDNSFDANDLLPGQRRSWSDSITEADAVSVNLPALGGNPTASRGWHVESMGSDPARAVQYATENFGTGTVRGRTFVRVRHDTTWHPWQEVIRTGSLLQATGSSTVFPMSQASTTNQLATKAPLSHTHPWSQVTGAPAQATRWPTFAEVTDKPLIYPTNWATVTDKPVVQTVGTSTTNLMSQAAVTSQLDTKAALRAASNIDGGVRMRLSGATLYITNDGSDA